MFLLIYYHSFYFGVGSKIGTIYVSKSVVKIPNLFYYYIPHAEIFEILNESFPFKKFISTKLVKMVFYKGVLIFDL